MAHAPDLAWIGPVFDPSGYADEGRGLLCALERRGVRVALRPVRRYVPGFREGLPRAERAILERQIDRPLPARSLVVQHHTADGFAPVSDEVYHIGRTMYETDGVPPSWVTHCNRMDELWLPSRFNLDTFRRAGVTVPIVLVPGGIDTTTYRPDGPALPVAGLRGTVFLSVFEWRLGKGWDVLLRAWADAFRPDDDVTLVLRTYPLGRVAGQDNAATINARIDAFLQSACGRTRADVAPIVVLGEAIPAEQMPALYRIASALVAPTRGEGWGRPFMEAMATGLPVIATNWSAHLEFMHAENSLLLDITGLEDADGAEVPLYAGQRWAVPSVVHLVERLREVHADRDGARALGRRAREEMVADWPWQRAAAVIAERLAALRERSPDTGARARSADGATLQLTGRFFAPRAPDRDRDRLAGAIAAQWTGALAVHTTGPGAERPSHASPAIAAWRARRDGERQVGVGQAPTRESPVELPQVRRLHDEAAASVTVTWLDTAGDPPPRRPATAWWVIHTGDTVGDTVPGPLARLLRDVADDVWVPDAAAAAACRAIGVPDDRLWIVDVPAPLSDAPRGGPRFPTQRDRMDTVGARSVALPALALPADARDANAPAAGDRECVFVLPVVDARMAAAADALLRAWPHAFDAGHPARLLLHAPPSEAAAVADWADRVQQQLAVGRILGAPVELCREPLTDEEIAALARTADVVLLPVAAPPLRLVRLARAYGRRIVRGTSADRGPTDPEDRCVVQPPGAPLSLAAWRDALREAWRDAARVRDDDAARAMAHEATASPEPSVSPDVSPGVSPNVTSRVTAAPRVAEGHAHVLAPEPAIVALGERAVARLAGATPRPTRHAAFVQAARHAPHAPLHLDGARTTTILALVDWHDGEAGGVVRAYAQACDAADDCTLVVALDPAQGVDVPTVARIVDDAIRAAGRPEDAAPELLLVPDPLDDAGRAALLARCDAVIALDDPTLAEAARTLGKHVIAGLGRRAWRAVLGTPASTTSA